MIQRSLKTFSFGIILGVLLGLTAKFLAPGIYLYFLSLLEQKVQVQTAVAGGASRGVILNNFLAALLCSYGGYFTTRAFILLDSGSSPLTRRLSFFDPRISRLSGAELKYYLSLHTLPFFILSFNGFVLGTLFVLYTGNPWAYISGILPHGLFEIPAILLAGSIGYSIAGAVFANHGFETELKLRAENQRGRFLLVLGLTSIAAFLE